MSFRLKNQLETNYFFIVVNLMNDLLKAKKLSKIFLHYYCHSLQTRQEDVFCERRIPNPVSPLNTPRHQTKSNS